MTIMTKKLQVLVKHLCNLNTSLCLIGGDKYDAKNNDPNNML